MDDAELASLETRLVDLLEQHPDHSGLATALLGADDPLSDFIRTYEGSVFGAEGYDFHAGMKPYEQQSLFLVTVDLEGKVAAHIKRIVQARRTGSGGQHAGLTGIEVVDDRLTASVDRERVGLWEILDYHKILDIQTCLNLTSNIQTGRSKPSWNRPYSLISYKAVFKVTRVLGVDNIFAYMNRVAIRSLGRVGVEFEKLAGRDFHLPIPGRPGSYDLNYEAICIPGTRHNLEVFSKDNPEKPFTTLIAGLDVPLFRVDSVNASVVELGAAMTGR